MQAFCGVPSTRAYSETSAFALKSGAWEDDPLRKLCGFELYFQISAKGVSALGLPLKPACELVYIDIEGMGSNKHIQAIGTSFNKES
eukprot:659459-Pelagomonas_calceolata.AAC.2